MTATQKPPPIQFSAQLFIQLARMEETGLPAIKAFQLLENSDKNQRQRLLKTQHYLNSGSAIHQAGFKTGIFTPFDKTLIQAAENSGQLTSVYRQLAKFYEQKLSRLKKIKSRLFFPIAILTLALFIQPLPLFITGKIDAFGYLSTTLGRIIVIALSAWLFLKLPRVLEIFGLSELYHRIQLQLFPKWIIKRQHNHFLFILAMMLEAGVSFSDALPQAVASIQNSVLKKQFNPLLNQAFSGKSATQLLSQVDTLSSFSLEIIRTGEESGKLAQSLLHFSHQEAETISLQDEMLAEWLPRMVYLVIAIWMAKSILESSFSSVPI